MSMKQEENCDVCYQIRCCECGWMPSEEEVTQIQCGAMTACPVCGWKPK